MRRSSSCSRAGCQHNQGIGNAGWHLTKPAARSSHGAAQRHSTWSVARLGCPNANLVLYRRGGPQGTDRWYRDNDHTYPDHHLQIVVHGAHTAEIGMPESVGAVFLTNQSNIVLAAMASSIVEVNISQKTITRVMASIPQALREQAGHDMRFGEGQVSPGGVLFCGWRHADRQADGRIFR